MRKKKKRRLFWFEWGAIEEAESWLMDLAAQGWHLSGSGPIFWHFSQGEPQEIRYRCDVFRRDEEFQERISVYTQAGWEYVTSINRQVHVFRGPADEAPEIHTEPVEMVPSISLLLRPYIWLGLFPLTAVAMLLISILGRGTIPWMLLHFDNLSLIFLLVLIFYLFVVGRGIIGVLRKRSKLRRGMPLAHGKSYRRYLATMPGILVAILALSVLALGFSINVFSSEGISPFPENEVPVVRIFELIPEAQYVPGESMDTDYDNGYRTSTSFLVPWQWFSYEFAGQVTGQGAYQTSLITSAYRARTPGLANRLARELVRNSPYTPDGYARNMHRVESFTGEMWLHQDGNIHEFVILEEDYVFHVLYNGLEPVEDLVDLLNHKITKRDLEMTYGQCPSPRADAGTDFSLCSE